MKGRRNMGVPGGLLVPYETFGQDRNKTYVHLRYFITLPLPQIVRPSAGPDLYTHTSMSLHCSLAKQKRHAS